ncbi:hypothetical protein NS277_13075 [Novosphingobium barchaimii]|nr:hypothetical protein NS277_13075 [Novosphingobium barchaimii]
MQAHERATGARAAGRRIFQRVSDSGLLPRAVYSDEHAVVEKRKSLESRTFIGHHAGMTTPRLWQARQLDGRGR